MYAPKREREPDYDERLGRWILGGLVLVALGAGAWYWLKREPAEPATQTIAPEPAATKPAIQNPIETPAGIDPNLPADQQVAALVGAPRFETMFVPDDFVRKLVATVDNLTRPKIAARMNPAKAPAGEFVTAGPEEDLVLGAQNFARYTPWIELGDALDPETTAEIYRRLYPQFQAEYENLGNPDGYFNDRVIEVIDHLLSMPEPPDTLALKRPNVMYEFADPTLEAESSGRKLLLRMGPGNAARVKMKLRDIRDRIARQAQ